MAWGLSTEQGRRMLYALSMKPLLDKEPYTGEACSRDYNLGLQAAARWLRRQLERVDPDLFDKMVLEGLREARNDRVHSAPDASQ